jgi:molybdopterin converting factor small subunit
MDDLMEHDQTTPSQLLPLTPLKVKQSPDIVTSDAADAVVPGFDECEDMSDVENNLREISELRDEWSGVQAHATAQIEEATQWRDHEIEIIRAQIVQLQASVSAWFKRPENNPNDKASRRLINGTIKRQAGSLSTEIIDADLVPREWCKTTYTPDKTRAKKHFMETGELIEGLEFNKGETIWYVDTGHDNKLRGV